MKVSVCGIFQVSFSTIVDYVHEVMSLQDMRGRVITQKGGCLLIPGKP